MDFCSRRCSGACLKTSLAIPAALALCQVLVAQTNQKVVKALFLSLVLLLSLFQVTTTAEKNPTRSLCFAAAQAYLFISSALVYC